MPGESTRDIAVRTEAAVNHLTELVNGTFQYLKDCIDGNGNPGLKADMILVKEKVLSLEEKNALLALEKKEARKEKRNTIWIVVGLCVNSLLSIAALIFGG